MNKPTIFNDSKVVINQANSRKRNRKKRDKDGGDPTTNVSCEIDTNYTAKFMINNVDILSPWNQYKIHCQNYLSRGSSTVETDTAKLLSQAYIMLLKRDAVDSDLKEMLGSGVVEEINNKVKECFGGVASRNGEDTIKDTIDKKINSREASSKIMSFCSKKMNTPLDDVLHIIRNFIERIPQKKYNQQIQENNLSCTYVDALIRPLVECPDDNIFLIWYLSAQLCIILVKSSARNKNFGGEKVVRV